MSEAQKGLTIGNPNDPARIAGRIQRLRQSIERADGERKAEMQAELDGLLAKVEAIKASLAALG